MWYVLSWWLMNITISLYWAIGAFFASLLIPNMTCFAVIYIFFSVYLIGILLTLNSYLKKKRDIENFLRHQDIENAGYELPLAPIISKNELRKGMFKYNISCRKPNSFAFHAQLFAKESEEVLSTYQ